MLRASCGGLRRRRPLVAALVVVAVAAIGLLLAVARLPDRDATSFKTPAAASSTFLTPLQALVCESPWYRAAPVQRRVRVQIEWMNMPARTDRRQAFEAHLAAWYAQLDAARARPRHSSRQSALRWVEFVTPVRRVDARQATEAEAARDKPFYWPEKTEPLWQYRRRDGVRLGLIDRLETFHREQRTRREQGAAVALPLQDELLFILQDDARLAAPEVLAAAILRALGSGW